jgi:NAD+ kinase
LATTIAIFGRHPKPESYPYVQELFNLLYEQDITFFVYEKLYQNLKDVIVFPTQTITFKNGESLEKNVDLMISLGGDGTLLNTLPILQHTHVPVLGINIGRLGFLTSVGKEDMPLLVDVIKTKNYAIDTRTLLQMDVDNNPFGNENAALNDFTIYRKDSASMIIVHVYLDGQFLNSYWADGLIIATPTGSTGYSLSCGGPIIFPTSKNFVITPIAPHNLNVRPIIISDDSKITIEIENRAPSYLISMDSRVAEMKKQVRFEFSKSPYQLQLARLHHVDFLSTLRSKLNWGLDTRN